ncbi:MAG: putative glycoside hydrolase [Clostridia bacterium]|nr:putative glycoside hydrolase [Clostridia bacterium]
MRRSNKVILIIMVVFLAIGGAYAGFYLTDKNEGNRLSQRKTESKGQEFNTTQDDTSKNKTTNPKNTALNPMQADRTAPKKQEVVRQKNFKNIKAKAVYLTGISAGVSKKIDQIIEISKKTELNAVVIDIKEDGVVNYKSNVPEVNKNKLYINYYNPEKVIKKLHDNNIYVIGRIVCFKDPGLASKRADLAIKRPNGQLWKESGIIPWTNPYNEEVWKYNIDISKEAISKGFDEIQYDYVRFPTVRKSDVNYGQYATSKADAISKFLEISANEIHKENGVPLSADVFGIICESPIDGESIGQVLERVGRDIDYISPMVYPSHYANASMGVMGNGAGQEINGVKFTAPDLEPYKVVYHTLIKGRNRIAKVQGYNAKIRPYLQAFTASYIGNKKYYQAYGAQQVRQQIKAVYDAGYDEWILWDPYNAYKQDYFEREK